MVKDLDSSSARYPTPKKRRKLNPQQKMKKRIVKLTLQKLGGGAESNLIADAFPLHWGFLEKNIAVLGKPCNPYREGPQLREKLKGNVALRVRVLKLVINFVAGSGSSEDRVPFLVDRVLQPSYIDLPRIFEYLQPACSHSSRLRTKQAIRSLANKVLDPEETVEDFLISMTTQKDRQKKVEAALAAIGELFTKLVEEGKQINQDFAKRLYAQVNSTLSKELVKEFGFKAGRRFMKTASRLTPSKVLDFATPVTDKRGRKPVSEDQKKSIEDYFNNRGNIKVTNSNPARVRKLVLDESGNPSPVLHLETTMDEAAKKHPLRITKAEREGGEIGLSASSIKKYVPKNVVKSKNQTGRCKLHRIREKLIFRYNDLLKLSGVRAKTTKASNRYLDGDDFDLARRLNQHKRKKLKSAVRQLRRLERHHRQHLRITKWWHDFQRDVPEDHIGIVFDFKAKIKLDQGDEADDMRNRKQATCFGLGLLLRRDDGSTERVYFDDISRCSSTSAWAAISHARATLKTPYVRELFRGMRICVAGGDNAGTFVSYEWAYFVLFEIPKIVRVPELEMRYHSMTIRHAKNFLDEHFGKISMWVIGRKSSTDGQGRSCKISSAKDVVKAIRRGQKRANLGRQERGVPVIRLKVSRTHVKSHNRFVKKLNMVGLQTTYSLIQRNGKVFNTMWPGVEPSSDNEIMDPVVKSRRNLPDLESDDEDASSTTEGYDAFKIHRRQKTQRVAWGEEDSDSEEKLSEL